MTDCEPWAGTSFSISVCECSALKKAGWKPIDRDWENWWTKDGKVAYPTNIAYKKMESLKKKK